MLKLIIVTLNSHEWPRKTFSLQYQHIIAQASHEDKEKCQFGFQIFIS